MPFIFIIKSEISINILNNKIVFIPIFIIIAFLTIVFIVFKFIDKFKKHLSIVSFEQQIIDTISKNKIIDHTFFENLNLEDMKSKIRQKIVFSNDKYQEKLDLEKMNVLMEKLELENIKKLYQWFFYKG